MNTVHHFRAICALALISFGIFSFARPAVAQNATQAAPAASADSGEDWSSLKLKKGELTALKPLVGEVDDVPDQSFVRTRYRMSWRAGDPLDVYVVMPRKVERPPLILYLYSFPQDTDRFKDDRWCATATSGGYAAIGFVSHLTGHRIHDRPVREWFISELPESLSATVHDVQMLLDFVDSSGEFDSKHIGMFGVGSGGSIAILAAAVDPRITAIDVLSPWADWSTWLAKSPLIPADERAKYTSPEFLAKVAPLDPVVWLPRVKAQVRIQDVRGIKLLPDESQQKLEAAAPTFAIVDQFENGRAFIPVSSGGKVFDWLKEQLQVVPPAAIASNAPGVHFYAAPPQERLPVLPTSN